MVEDEIKVVKIETAGDITEDQRAAIEERIQSLIGLKLLKCEGRTIWIEYFAHLFSEPAIRDELKGLGITFKVKKKGNFFERLLSTITNDNVKTFGKKRMDCCDLNP